MNIIVTAIRGLTLVLVLSFLLLAWFMAWPMQQHVRPILSQVERPAGVVHVGSAQLAVPPEFNSWKRVTKLDGERKPYEELEIGLNVLTFKEMEKVPGDEDFLKVRVRAIGSRWRDRNYWTEEDYFKKYSPISCAEKSYDGVRYVLCSLGTAGYAEDSGPEFFTVTRGGDAEFMSRIQCTDPDNFKESNLVYPQCRAQTKVNEQLLVEYSFASKYKTSILLINHRVRQLILSFVKRAGHIETNSKQKK